MTDETRFCDQCGAVVSEGADFCGSCGQVVGPADAAETSATSAPPPPVAAPAGGPPAGTTKSWVPLLVGLIGLLLVVGGVLFSQSEGDESSAAREILLTSAAEAGSDPFTPPVDPPVPAAAAVLVNAAPQSGVTPAAGAPLYGGSGDNRVCDREAMITFLTQNPDKGRAWADVAGIPYTDLASYIRTLTPTVLLYDTRVTNHSFSGGRATPLQSVLQAGTAVLVDSSGQPVAKCKCGNPLRPPIPAVADPTYVGTPWPGFQPGVFVTVVVVVNVPGTSEATSTTRATSTTKGSGSATDRVRRILQDQLAICGKSATITRVKADPDFPGSYIVDATVGGTSAEFVVNVDKGTIGEGDRASAAIVKECGLE